MYYPLFIFDIGWGTVIRTQECRSQSLFYCFILANFYCWMTLLKKAQNQVLLPIDLL